MTSSRYIIVLFGIILLISVVARSENMVQPDALGAEHLVKTADVSVENITFGTVVRRPISKKTLLSLIRRFCNVVKAAAAADPGNAKIICAILRGAAKRIEDLRTSKFIMKLLITLLVKILRALDCLVRGGTTTA